MSAQEKAGLRALAKHAQKKGTRDGQIHCVCGWKTQTMGQANQQKSFRRHQIREVLTAAKDVDGSTAEKITAVLSLHEPVWFAWVELDGTPGAGWICDQCTPESGNQLTRHPCPTYAAAHGEDAPDKWITEPTPGGYVCGVCEIPVESEPCPDHQPAAYERAVS